MGGPPLSIGPIHRLGADFEAFQPSAIGFAAQTLGGLRQSAQGWAQSQDGNDVVQTTPTSSSPRSVGPWSHFGIPGPAYQPSAIGSAAQTLGGLSQSAQGWASTQDGNDVVATVPFAGPPLVAGPFRHLGVPWAAYALVSAPNVNTIAQTLGGLRQSANGWAAGQQSSFVATTGTSQSAGPFGPWRRFGTPWLSYQPSVIGSAAQQLGGLSQSAQGWASTQIGSELVATTPTSSLPLSRGPWSHFGVPGRAYQPAAMGAASQTLGGLSQAASAWSQTQTGNELVATVPMGAGAFIGLERRAGRPWASFGPPPLPPLPPILASTVVIARRFVGAVKVDAEQQGRVVVVSTLKGSIQVRPMPAATVAVASTPKGAVQVGPTPTASRTVAALPTARVSVTIQSSQMQNGNPNPGDAQTYTCTITDPLQAFALVDPGSVTANMHDPSGGNTALTVTKVSTGVYRATFTYALVGVHIVRFTGTSPYPFVQDTSIMCAALLY
jgi:hypothetical protein